MKYMNYVPLLLLAGLSTSCHTSRHGWELVWEDDFNQPGSIDTATWSKIPRGKPEWAKCMSSDDRCYDIREGCLILKGIVNPDTRTDASPYLTGGVYTKNKRPFYQGKVEIRAKFGKARGAWPAIWMKPYEEARYKWPSGGEIDIMEHLNADSIVYQTVHTNYTHHLGIKNNPPHGGTARIHPDDYNVYGVEMTADSLVFSVNGQRTFTYPKIETDREGQYPFDKPYYLLIDMQLGGSWVGKVDSNDLPIEMEVDWVRYYKKK